MSSQMLKPLKPMNKKGQVGLGLAKGVVITLLIIVVVGFAAMIAVVQLNNAGVFTAGSQEANDSNNIVKNFTYGLTKFFSYAPTIFIMLGVLVIIAIVLLVVVYISRNAGGMGGNNGL